MKILILATSLLFSIASYAAPTAWSDLTPDATYTLTSEIPMAATVVLQAGHELVLKQIDTLDISVILFTFHDLSCTDQNLKTEMILFNPEPNNTADDKSVGMKYDTNCEISVFVESKNYYDRSIFN